MRTDHRDGSFSLTWEKMEATYDKNGKLIEARYRRKGSPRLNLSRHYKTAQWLQKQGTQEIDLLNRGILKRKTPNPIKRRRR